MLNPALGNTIFKGNAERVRNQYKSWKLTMKNKNQIPCSLEKSFAKAQVYRERSDNRVWRESLRYITYGISEHGIL